MSFKNFYVNKLFEDIVPGGKADNLTLTDIASKHNIPEDDLKVEFAMGVDHEMEHTDNVKIASEIARDHLIEDPKYYSKIKTAGIMDENTIKNISNRIKSALFRTQQPTKRDIDDNLRDTPLQRTMQAVNDIDDNLVDRADIEKAELWKKAIQYIQGQHDEDPESWEVWEESAEDLNELEILDEKRLERIKLARKLLRKIGYTNVFSRDYKNKYIIRAKRINDLMDKLGYEFDILSKKWIKKGKRTNTNKSNKDINVNDNSNEHYIESNNSIIWVGHANPWHKGHDLAIEKAIASLDTYGANKIYLLIVDEEELGFKNKYNLLQKIYSDNDKIEISKYVVNSKSITDVFTIANKLKINIKAWIIRDTDIYADAFEKFKNGDYKQDYVEKNPEGNIPFNQDINFIIMDSSEDVDNNQIISNVKKSNEYLIPTNELTSELCRELAKVIDFSSWIKQIVQEDVKNKSNILLDYKNFYLEFKGEQKDQ